MAKMMVLNSHNPFCYWTLKHLIVKVLGDCPHAALHYKDGKQDTGGNAGHSMEKIGTAAAPGLKT